MKERPFSHLLVTGGCGFMGSSFIRMLFENGLYLGKVINLDLLTYAGNPQNVKSVTSSPRYSFIQGNISDEKLLDKIVLEQEIDGIINFAAETHVDRSIASPSIFMDSNIRGTYTLLEVVRKNPHIHFHQISTDEVFGSLGESGTFSEHSPFRPNSPYAASKAAADHLVRSYVNTYKISATISHAANNYGPFQYPEKFIPLMTTRALKQKALPVYGRGVNIRDWLFVDDHARAIWTIIKRGKSGESYNIGGNEEIRNIDLLHFLLEIIAEEEGSDLEDLEKLISYIDDRPGHDFRYALSSEKIKSLGFQPEMQLKEGLRKTVRWFRKKLSAKRLSPN